jgi:prefoldin subunit 5
MILELEPALEQIKAQKEIITNARDELRNILEQLETEVQTFDEGVEDLESAIDLLSQYV